jgi:hypothetical protein
MKRTTKKDSEASSRSRKRRKFTHSRDDLWQDVHAFCKSNKLLKMIFPKQWEPLYLFTRKYVNDISVENEHLVELFKNSLICVPPDAPSTGNITFEQTQKQSAVVDRVISSIIQNKVHNVKHVLTLGYGAVRLLSTYLMFSHDLVQRELCDCMVFKCFFQTQLLTR